MKAMKTLPIRLTPGRDLRAAPEAEVLALRPDWQFTRESDVQTGNDELIIRARG